MMRRFPATRGYMKPHHGWLILDTREARALYDMWHKRMTVFDGVSNVFEVNRLIPADSH